MTRNELWSNAPIHRATCNSHAPSGSHSHAHAVDERRVAATHIVQEETSHDVALQEVLPANAAKLSTEGMEETIPIAKCWHHTCAGQVGHAGWRQK